MEITKSRSRRYFSIDRCEPPTPPRSFHTVVPALGLVCSWLRGSASAPERITMDTKSPTWQDAVDCGCEEEWLDAYNSQFDG